ncbi:FecR domain-containing protein, partial [uncultured Duncaniella sp.]
TPLPDVLKRLSAHFNVSLTCSSTGKVLTAEFETDNLDEIIMLIEKSLDVKIEKETK